MTFDQPTLGRRLREARESRSLSQQAAADTLGLPRTAMTQIEAGNRSVSTLELAQLAELYRRPVAGFFQEGPLQEDELLVALHRLAPDLNINSDIKDQVEQCLSIVQEGCALERLLGRPPRSGPPAYPTPAPRTVGEAITQGEQVATQERKRLGLGHAPLADMAELIADQGIWAAAVSLPDAMSGLFLRHTAIGMAILVNLSHVRARQRFSYAHEYAHALLDREQPVTISTSDNASELIEKRANAFAAAFLLPGGGVMDLLRALDKGQPSRQEQAVFDVATQGRIEAYLRPVPGSQAITYQDVALLAHHFGVSYQAATYRLRSLNLVSQQEGNALLNREQAGKDLLGLLKMLDDLEKTENQERQDRELKTQVVHLALEAYRREEISRGKLLELSTTLGLPGPKLVELAEAAKPN